MLKNELKRDIYYIIRVERNKHKMKKYHQKERDRERQRDRKRGREIERQTERKAHSRHRGRQKETDTCEITIFHCSNGLMVELLQLLQIGNILPVAYRGGGA